MAVLTQKHKPKEKKNCQEHMNGDDKRLQVSGNHQSSHPALNENEKEEGTGVPGEIPINVPELKRLSEKEDHKESQDHSQESIDVFGPGFKRIEVCDDFS